MENIFKELKKKIENYKKILEVNTVEVDNSEVSKIEDEIKTLKSKIDELNTSMERKSKIEKMKITLNRKWNIFKRNRLRRKERKS